MSQLRCVRLVLVGGGLRADSGHWKSCVSVSLGTPPRTTGHLCLDSCPVTSVGGVKDSKSINS